MFVLLRDASVQNTWEYAAFPAIRAVSVNVLDTPGLCSALTRTLADIPSACVAVIIACHGWFGLLTQSESADGIGRHVFAADLCDAVSAEIEGAGHTLVAVLVDACWSAVRPRAEAAAEYPRYGYRHDVAEHDYRGTRRFVAACRARVFPAVLGGGESALVRF